MHALNTGVHRERRHGHEYGLEVSFQGCTIAAMDAEVETAILSEVHGRELKSPLDPATGEVLVEWIHSRLQRGPLGDFVRAVAIQETRKNRFVSSKSEARFV